MRGGTVWRTALAVSAVALTLLFWPVGIVLVWISSRFRTQDKVVATVLPFAAWLVIIAGFAVGLFESEPGAGPLPIPSLGDSLAGLFYSFLPPFSLVGGPMLAALYLGANLLPRAGRLVAVGTILLVLLVAGLALLTFS